MDGTHPQNQGQRPSRTDSTHKNSGLNLGPLLRTHKAPVHRGNTPDHMLWSGGMGNRGQGDRPPTIHHTPPKATTKQGHKTDHGRLQELPNNSARTGNRHPTNRIIHPRPNARPRTKSQHRNSPPRYPPEVPPNTMDTKKASKVATAPQYPHTGRTAETGRSHRDTKSRGSNHSNDRQPTRQAMAQRALGQ